MKSRLLDYIVCPMCEGQLTLSTDGSPGGDEILSGTLSCAGCETIYPIIRGIPRLLPPELSPDKRVTASRFGWQWRHFVDMHDEHRGQFLDWIWPLRPEFFSGKVVLDAGCGIGRHTLFASEFGASEVMAIDLSEAVETAYETVGARPNVHVIQADIYHPPFRRSGHRRDFDFVYSIGVIHHLPDPKGGFASLARLLKPGGEIFAWVYGQENNGIVHYFINPLRKRLTSRMSPRALLAFAYPLAVVMHAIVKGVYHPLRRTPLFRLLPSHAYLESLSAFTFRQNYAIVFDHLTAPTAFYIPEMEFKSWFTELGLVDQEFSWRNENSWRGRGRRPIEEEAILEGTPP